MKYQITLAYLFGLASAGDATIECDITTDNSYAYMCSKMGITTVTNAGPLACVQEDMTGDSSDTEITSTNWAVECSDTNDGQYIQCFEFASYGKTAGSCAEITDDSETCMFKDDGDKYVWFPEDLGTACIGQTECPFTLQADGFTGTDGTVYDLTGDTDSGYSLDGNNQKFKMLAYCGSSDAAFDGETIGAIRGMTVVSSTAALVLMSLMG